jgi:hypothetical protein
MYTLSMNTNTSYRTEIQQGDRVKIGYRTGKCMSIEDGAYYIVFDDVPHMEARWINLPKSIAANA